MSKNPATSRQESARGLRWGRSRIRHEHRHAGSTGIRWPFRALIGYLPLPPGVHTARKTRRRASSEQPGCPCAPVRSQVSDAARRRSFRCDQDDEGSGTCGWRRWTEPSTSPILVHTLLLSDHPSGLGAAALEPRRAACLVLGAGSAASLASWAAGKARPAMRRWCLPAPERCPAAASRRARALREHCGGTGRRRRAAHPARPRSAQHPQSGRIRMGDGDHPGVRGLALTRLRARAGGQMRAGPFRRGRARACPP
jgi:hypothetical protein